MSKPHHPLQRLLAGSALVLSVLAAATAHAGPYSSLTVFGDSLSDTGNVLALSSTFSPVPFPVPFPVYPAAPGRFSDGSVWVEHLAAGLGLPTGAQPANLLLTSATAVSPIGAPGGLNFAFGGARTGLGGSVGPTTGLLGQLAAWNGAGFASSLSRAADPDGLYVVVIGGNDLRDARNANPGASLAEAEARTLAAGNAVQGLINSVGLLAQAGARHFLLATLPDLGGTPEAVRLGRVDASTDVTLKFNAALMAGASAFDAQFLGLTGVDLDIRMVDFFALGQDIIDDAVNNGGGTFGITNINTPCLTPGAVSRQFFAPDAVASNCGSSASSDDLHPTARVHSLFGNAALAAVPVAPTLPLVAVALLGLALTSRRQTRPLA